MKMGPAGAENSLCHDTLLRTSQTKIHLSAYHRHFSSPTASLIGLANSSFFRERGVYITFQIFPSFNNPKVFQDQWNMGW